MTGTVREGDWKLVWKAIPPRRLELFDPSKDKAETANIADQNPETVNKPQAKITAHAREMAPPPIPQDAARMVLHSETVLPDAPEMFNAGD